MKRLAENSTAAAVLLTLILGGYGYVLTVSFKGDANAKAIESLQERQENLDSLRVDVAVIKEQVLEIRKHLDKQ